MTWYKPWTWFDKKEPVIEKSEEDDRDDGDFSTGLRRWRMMRHESLVAWIEGNIFQKTHKDIKRSEALTGDSVIAMDESIKSAYAFTGNNLPDVLFAWYVSQGFIGYQACAILAQNALINKACTKPAKKALKKGYELTVNDGSKVDPKILKAIRKTDKKFKVRENLIQYERMKRIFGIRIAIFVVESSDPQYYRKPFNLDGITKGSYKGISQVDPYWCSPELDSEATTNPASKDFYEPTYWIIGGERIHKSHLVIVRHSEPPDILKPSYNYGGIPLPQLIYERVYAAERTANEAPMLALTKRVNVVKADLDKAAANQKAFEERLKLFNDFRDNYGVFAIGKQEEFQQTDTALGDLDNVIMTQYQLVAALADMPATELIETSPKGFNATGEFEQKTFYDSLEAIRVESYDPLLERHYQCVIRSEIAPKFAIELFETEIEWEPLDSPTAKEIAEINFINAQTYEKLQTAGSIDGKEIRDALIEQPTSGFNGIEPLEYPPEELPKEEAELQAEGESEEEEAA